MILVTGGAGYIGSHVVKALIMKNYQVVVIDNLSTGNQEAIDPKAIFVKGDVRNPKDLGEIFSKYPVCAVMHFAANAYVGESVEKPAVYYSNNVNGMITLLKMMVQYHVKKIVFSSSCAVYGKPPCKMINESTPAIPINPYGWTKLIGEQLLRDFSTAYSLKYIALRYFNVAGAIDSGELGEDHTPETHLIPNIIKHLLGETKKIFVYGNDYETRDGTCIRDYIHVTDLSNAHILALEALLDSKAANRVYNVGNEKGISVNEIIKMCETIIGRKATVEYAKRRDGDPPALIASADMLKKEFNWKAQFDLKDMIESAYQWFLKNPKGYKKP
ncbi:UDP-glucose 4-epimerase GalE [Fictibacillus sp. KU28468]|uniref:UDP-glucose 4-epimerase GalE n=1 Tax=Fictibacillus sp. KU28468 TaxID=2991053 RepID=UPI00223DD0AF|nr:UDP-glucose 4-epimerase GalE [Fictibacillus sp. KU28468]UZJ77353.1 UDP-glucose 4-epimerase GalE [Fictibacillus sp. KU28468]